MIFSDKDTDKNLKDTNLTPNPLILGEGGKRLSYSKTQKLITALYMVTDIIDSDEPLKNKLRTLGLQILSDTNHSPVVQSISNNIDQVMSFLNIASAMNLISEMNCTILQKEFSELSSSVQQATHVKPDWLKEFLVDSSSHFQGRTEERFVSSPHPNPLLGKERGNFDSKGHTRIGVQKGSTLMQALSDKMSLRKNFASGGTAKIRGEFDILKKQRREDIIDAIRKNGGSANITDIKSKAQGQLISCSEKTLQRELVSMIKDDVLYKTGEKRWSRYFIRG